MKPCERALKKNEAVQGRRKRYGCYFTQYSWGRNFEEFLRKLHTFLHGGSTNLHHHCHPQYCKRFPFLHVPSSMCCLQTLNDGHCDCWEVIDNLVVVVIGISLIISDVFMFLFGQRGPMKCTCGNWCLESRPSFEFVCDYPTQGIS